MTVEIVSLDILTRRIEEKEFREFIRRVLETITYEKLNIPKDRNLDNIVLEFLTSNKNSDIIERLLKEIKVLIKKAKKEGKSVSINLPQFLWTIGIMRRLYEDLRKHKKGDLANRISYIINAYNKLSNLVSRNIFGNPEVGREWNERLYSFIENLYSLIDKSIKYYYRLHDFGEELIRFSLLMNSIGNNIKKVIGDVSRKIVLSSSYVRDLITIMDKYYYSNIKKVVSQFKKLRKELEDIGQYVNLKIIDNLVNFLRKIGEVNDNSMEKTYNILAQSFVYRLTNLTDDYFSVVKCFLKSTIELLLFSKEVQNTAAKISGVVEGGGKKIPYANSREKRIIKAILDSNGIVYVDKNGEIELVENYTGLDSLMTSLSKDIKEQVQEISAKTINLLGRANFEMNKVKILKLLFLSLPEEISMDGLYRKMFKEEYKILDKLAR